MKPAFLFLYVCVCLLWPLAALQAQTEGSSRSEKLAQLAYEAYTQGDFEVALRLSQEAVIYHQSTSNWEAAVAAEIPQLHLLLQQNHLEEVLQKTLEGLALPAEVLSVAHPLRARLYVLQGAAYLYQARLTQAQESLHRAVKLLDTLAESPQQTQALAEYYNYQALYFWSNANETQALEFHQKALALRRQLFGDDHPEVAGSYNNIGLLYAQSNPVEALHYYALALQIYKHHFVANHPQLANLYNNMGIICFGQGQYEAALDFFETSLELQEQRYGRRHPNIAFVLTWQGQIYGQQGDNIAARQLFDEALDIYQKSYGGKHPSIAQTLHLIGDLALNQRQYEAALGQYQQALRANSIGFDSGDFHDNPSIEQSIDPEVLLSTWVRKTRVLEAWHLNQTLKMSHIQAAYQLMQQSDVLINYLRQRRSQRQDKIKLGSNAAEVYALGVRIARYLSTITPRKQHYLTEAFYFSEKNKAMVLLSSLVESEAKQFAGIPDELLVQEQQYKAQLTQLEQALLESKSEAARATLFEQRFAINRAYEALLAQMEREYPAYHQLKHSAAITDISVLQATLPTDAAMLHYFWDEEQQQVYIFVLRRNGLKVHTRSIDRKLVASLQAFSKALRIRHALIQQQVGHLLYQRLIPPLPNGVHRLLVIPEDLIHQVAFEAILQKPSNLLYPDYQQLPYLSNRYAISYHYSATLWQQGQQGRLTSNSQNKMLLCAPVTFKQPFLTDLPATATEVAQIAEAATASGLTTKILQAQTADEATFKSQPLADYRWIHLATHGSIDVRFPELSRIYLATDTSSLQEDGQLLLGEMYNLSLRAELLCLSACQTALGTLSKGEGVIGLTRALLYAGVQNIVVSQWQVDDEATAWLMQAFYEHLLSSPKPDYGVSLQKAKNELRQHPKYAAPYYWAAFVLIGQ
ncbi:CHAT domain-containing protein [Eisenibacter elegans]|uniref:CHAT domain-containing protein n=1 Tax=Eisenibacter elegans TaxID=997 RepID=UPI0004066CF9|nr:CHAT domain-containing tetratricopeptide repeat protein [Eisenibacter elegans]